MKISVVVPAFNEEKLIGDTLRKIQAASAAFHPLGWETELVVCNNNSTDRTAEIAQAAGARVVFEPFNQISRARNTGAAAAAGDWLIFVDADSSPTPELFADVAAAIRQGRCLAGGCTMSMPDAPFLAACTVKLWNGLSRLRKWAAGSFLFCEAAAFRQVGGFSLELFASEEIDLSDRLHALARQTGRTLVILHRHPMVTSSRKLHLYGHRAHFRFISRTIRQSGRTLRDREACHIWYDGRR